MCNDNDEDQKTGFRNLGALADFITGNSYFPKPWQLHERIEKPDEQARDQD